jgi:outer membrane protein TolC
MLLAPLVTAGCAAAWQGDYDRLRSELDPIVAEHRAAPAGPSTDAELDRALSGPLDLETLRRAARARNPELREASARVQAALEEARRAGAFDDPMLAVRTERVPWRSPAAVNQAAENMLSLTQSIPFPGNLGLREEAAFREAESLYQTYRERERDLEARLKKAYFEYFALVKELEVHREHVRILEDFEKVSDVKFRTGAASQQDVLKPQVEAVLLHNDVLSIEQKLGSARAEINVILHRPADAPLGEPREPVPVEESFDVKDLAAKALAARPEVRAAELRVRSSRAGLRLAERESVLPDFTVEFGAMQMPEEPDGWAGMFGINLPWLTGKKRAEARRMGHVLRAEEAALEGVRGRVLFEVRDAGLRVDAAARSLALFRRELLPKSAQGVEVSRAGYEKDKATVLDLLDAERSLRDVKLKYYQAVARYESAVADLERAAGLDLRRTP